MTPFATMKSPVDTGIFFLLIGIGMTCGIERPGTALFGALFLILWMTLRSRIGVGLDESDKETRNA